MNVDDAVARLDASIGSLSDMLADLERGAEHEEHEAAAETERIAEANRRGERGPEWKVLQQRIDRGDTTVEDVFSGADTSREAVAVTALSRRNLAALSEQLDQEAQQDPEAFDPRSEADAIAADLAARVADVKRRLGIE